MTTTIEVPDEYENGVVSSLEEMLFEIEMVDEETYRVTGHNG